MTLFKKFVFVVSVLFCAVSISSFSYAETKSNTAIEKQQETISQININTATAEELAKNLTGIGLSKAKKIVEYREKLGPFVSIEQIKEVSGIGQSILDKNIGKIIL